MRKKNLEDFQHEQIILKSKMPICLKRKIYIQCVIPAMTYVCETWKLTKQTENLFRIAQKAMERTMLGMTLRDRKRSAWIREKTRIKDIIQVFKQQKQRWARHVARMNDNRWTKRLTEWHPYNDKRSRKRPDTRWRDEIEKFAGVAWQRLAQDRQLWRELGKAFVQQWTYNG